MYVVVRSYSGAGASELFDLIEQSEGGDTGAHQRGARLRHYAAFRSGDGGTTVTVCQDKAGTDESSNRAAAWIKENASGTSVSPPEITEGSTVLQF